MQQEPSTSAPLLLPWRAMRPAGTDARTAPRGNDEGDAVASRHIVSSVELVVLVSLVAWVLWAFPRCLDLHPADEAGYEAVGHALLRGDASRLGLAWSPLTSLAYAALQPFRAWGVFPADVWFVAVFAGSTAACYVAMRQLAPRAAFVVAALWCGCPPVLQFDGGMRLPSVYLSGAMLLFGALAAFASRRFVLGCVLFFLAALNRSELAPWLVAFALGCTLLRPAGVRRELALGVVAAATLLLVAQVASTEVRAKTWMAFYQHYEQAHAVEGVPSSDSFVQVAPVVRETFGEADGLLAAVRAQPAAVLEHVLHNLASIPSGLIGAFGRSYGFHLGLRVALLSGLGVLVLLGQRRRGARGDTAALSPLAGTFAATAPFGLLGVLLAAPRPELLLAVTPALCVGIAWLARGGGTSWATRALAYGLPLFVLTSIVTTTGPFASAEPPRLVTREVVALCREQMPAGARLLGEFGFGWAFLADPEHLSGHDAVRGSSLAAMVEELGATHVAFAPKLHHVMQHPLIGVRELLDAPHGLLGAEFVSPNGTLLVDLGADETPSATRRARPRLTLASDREREGGGRRLAFLAEDLPPAATAVLQLVHDGAFQAEDILQSVTVGADATARFTIDVPADLVGTTAEIRAWSLLSGDRLFVAPAIQVVVGG
jgi:hypothetical protein